MGENSNRIGNKEIKIQLYLRILYINPKDK
jgi:hypothetical protein